MLTEFVDDLDTGSLSHNSLVQNTNLVQMSMDDTMHYRPGSPTSQEEHELLLPARGHLIHGKNADGEDTVFTVALFHQLKCLGILQKDYTSRSPSSLSQHCLNYLRQSVLCTGDRTLESIRSPLAPT